MCEFLSDEYLHWYGPLEPLAESTDLETLKLARMYKKGRLQIRMTAAEGWPATIAAELDITRSQLMCELDGIFGPASLSIKLDAFGVPWITSIALSSSESSESGADDP